ncbi:MAG: SMP-30/gluconolactonase/LRE family protein [Cyclobacteriaceae bacterium]
MKYSLLCLLKLFSVFGCIASISACTENQLYQPYDLTGEQLFSENIEGPVWKDSCWYVVNFRRDGTVGTVNISGRAAVFVELPAGSNANSILFNSAGEMLLADWPMNQILKVAPGTKVVSVFIQDTLFHQPNDFTINRQGQIFASDPDWKNGSGRIWRIEPDGSRVILKEGMGTTNGITLSPSEDILYVNESLQRQILELQVDENGNLKQDRVFAAFDDFGLDGMKCDRDGNLYVTRHGKGTVVVFNPSGKVIREITLKGKKPSNLAFGGKDGKTCIVTLQDRGSIEAFRTEIPGAGF